MKLLVIRDAESKLIQFIVKDSSQTDGSGLTGLVFNSVNLTAYYYREGAVAPVQINLVDMTVGTWASGGFKEVHAANTPGLYQIGVPDAALADGAESVDIILKGAADMAQVDIEIQLDLGDVVWDEVLTGATHNVPTSAGRRLRGIQEFQGYALGSIWIDTNNGTAGTVDYENGTVERPVRSIADALVLALSLGIVRFQIAPGSAITFAANMDGKMLEGHEWSLALGGQSCDDTIVKGAVQITGIATAASHMHILDCEVGAISIGPSHVFNCGLNDDITLSAAGDYYFDGCYHGAPGADLPSFDFGAAVGNTNLHMHHWSGGIEIENLGRAGTDTMDLAGDGQLVINSNCTGGTVTIAGNFTVVDNAAGVVTLSDDARYDVGQINDEVVDVMRTDTVAEIAAVPASNAPLHSMIQWLFTIVRNKRITTADLDTLRNNADGADIATAPLTPTATTFTRGKYS